MVLMNRVTSVMETPLKKTGTHRKLNYTPASEDDMGIAGSSSSLLRRLH